VISLGWLKCVFNIRADTFELSTVVRHSLGKTTGIRVPMRIISTVGLHGLGDYAFALPGRLDQGVAPESALAYHGGRRIDSTAASYVPPDGAHLSAHKTAARAVAEFMEQLLSQQEHAFGISVVMRERRVIIFEQRVAGRMGGNMSPVAGYGCRRMGQAAVRIIREACKAYSTCGKS
jgi:hypothetical protein